MKRPTISFIIHNLYDPYCQTLFSGVSEGARRFGVNLLCFPGRDIKSPREFDVQANRIYDLSMPQGTDGIIISANVITNFVRPAEVKYFYDRFHMIPTVSIAVPISGIPTVGIDNIAAMSELVRHMVDHHAYRRIAFIAGPLKNPEVELRYSSYHKVLHERNIPFDPDLVVEGDFERPTGYEAIRILMDERRVKFDAVIAANDNMAVGALEALRERGIRVPEKVALAGFDDNRPGFAATPPLTTIHQPIYEMGIKSVEMMLDLLNGKTVPEQIHLPTHLVIRESCGCLPFIASQYESVKQLTERKGLTQRGLSASLKKDSKIRDLEFGIDVIVSLVSALFSDLHNPKSSRFIQHLHDRVKANILAGQSLAPWQQLISKIRIHSLNFDLDAGEFHRLSDLLDQARCHIAEAKQRSFHQIQLQHETHARILREIGESLTTRYDAQDLMRDLYNALMRIEIQTGYVALFESFGNKMESDQPSAHVHLKLAFLDGKRVRFRDPGPRFPSNELIPFKLRPGERYTLIVLPLYFRTEHFGYAVIDHLPSLSGLTYESLRDQISIALHGIRFHQNLILAKEESEDRAQKLDESNKELEQFAYVASHDLQEPLRMVSSYVSLLSKRYQDKLDKDAEEFIGFALDGTSRMRILIQDLLNYSRITTQAKPFKSIDTKEILQAALDNLQVTIKETSTEVTHSPLPKILADQHQLIRLFQNLIGNAIKYNQNQPKIHVSAKKKENRWIFSFKDNGIGIDPRYQDKIFGIFTRLHGRDEYSGTGIGLAVSKKIVERHGGKIWVESKGGKGSTFYFTIHAKGETP